jgi:hypothetical protein
MVAVAAGSGGGQLPRCWFLRCCIPGGVGWTTPRGRRPSPLPYRFWNVLGRKVDRRASAQEQHQRERSSFIDDSSVAATSAANIITVHHGGDGWNSNIAGPEEKGGLGTDLPSLSRVRQSVLPRLGGALSVFVRDTRSRKRTEVPAEACLDRPCFTKNACCALIGSDDVMASGGGFWMVLMHRILRTLTLEESWNRYVVFFLVRGTMTSVHATAVDRRNRTSIGSISLGD